MHEAMIAQSILEAIIQEAAERGLRPLRARISCGELNPINDEAVNFAFEIAARGTACEGMRLEVRHVPLRATCESCGHTFEFDIYSPACPGCGGADFKMNPDAPLLLEEIEFEDT
ncbi:MAG: hydrogenase maturation nickel metallochaperone HypA [Phycisphaerae bacterium]|nr:hydrogenase maturation nickel metallochaperone HypA [Phycisphaerae bacterium]